MGTVPLWRGAFDAVLLDLDGVLTRTARLHAQAWKETFDPYLGQRAKRRGDRFQPFDADSDYRRYVDGRLRDVGGGVEVDQHAVGFVRRLRQDGVRTAVVSSSRNCRRILEATELSAFFDVVLDGTDRARLGLAGKPAPDLLLEATRQLAVVPSRTIVVEDAPVGVAAGRRGAFGCVIGVDRVGHGAALRVAGADFTVGDLSAVFLTIDAHEALRPTSSLPTAFEQFDDLTRLARANRLALFLDYDGTLTPIVSRPELARLPEDTRRTLRRLGRLMPVVIVSGRDLGEVTTFVAVEGLFYAGSHGFEIVAPDGRRLDEGQGDSFLRGLDAAERDLRQAVADIRGAVVERKRFAIAVHFRHVGDADAPRVAAAVDGVAADHRELRRTEGKRVFELRPDIEWHKGTAVRHLMAVLGLPPDRGVPTYIGDDLTDEDAFRAIARDGVPIVVRDEPRLTFARSALDGPAEVAHFLEALRASVAG